jgi:hypothetical protein
MTAFCYLVNETHSTAANRALTLPISFHVTPQWFDADGLRLDCANPYMDM